MTKITNVYRGPFTAPRKSIVDKPGECLILGDGCPIRDRFLYLARMKKSLASCQNLPELQEKILDLAFKNFTIVGKSAVYAGFWFHDEFTAYTIPQDRPPFPGNAGRYVSIGKTPIHLIRPELIKKAVETKDLVPGKSENEEFLAVPLVTKDRGRVFGIMLLSNRLSDGRNKFTKDDIKIARALGEVASEAICRFPETQFQTH